MWLVLHGIGGAWPTQSPRRFRLRHHPACRMMGLDSNSVVGTDVGSSAGDVSEAPRDTDADEPMGDGRKKGLGVLGVLLTIATTIFSNRILAKVCQFCGKAFFSPDELDPSRTMSWWKPNGGGLVCAYCGITRQRRFPHLKMADMLREFATNQAVARSFLSFRSWLISEYKAGNRNIRSLAYEAAPRQTVDKFSTVDCVAENKGVLQLYTTYFTEFGDPRVNGLGHTGPFMSKWKDGSMREVVAIPTTDGDKMEVSWRSTTGISHNTVIDDGSVTQKEGQQAEIFEELQAGHQDNFKGKTLSEISVAMSKGPAASSQPSSSSGGVAVAASARSDGASSATTLHFGAPGAALAADGVDDEASVSEEEKEPEAKGPFDLLAALSGSSQAMAEVKPIPPKGSAKAKACAVKREAAGSIDMPPPLAKTPRRAAGSARRALVAAVGESAPDKLAQQMQIVMDKCFKDMQSFANCDKAYIQNHCDKKWYKKVSVLCKSLSALGNTEEILKATKELNLIVDYCKAYRNYLKKGSRDEYREEKGRLTTFAGQPPVCDVELPRCMKQDELAIKFSSMVDDMLGNPLEADMLALYKCVSADVVATMTMVDEADSFVADLWETQCFVPLLSLYVKEEDPATPTLRLLHRLLEHAPGNGQAGAGFSLAPKVAEQLAKLKCAFGSSDFSGRVLEAKQTIEDIVKSDLPLLKMFSSMLVGTKVVRAVTAAIASQGCHETTMKRIAQHLTAVQSCSTMADFGKLQALDLEFANAKMWASLQEKEKECVFAALDKQVEAYMQLAEGIFTNLSSQKFEDLCLAGDRVDALRERVRMTMSLNFLKLAVEDEIIFSKAKWRMALLDYLRLWLASPCQVLTEGDFKLEDFERASLFFAKVDSHRLVGFADHARVLSEVGWDKLIADGKENINNKLCEIAGPKLNRILPAIYMYQPFWDATDDITDWVIAEEEAFSKDCLPEAIIAETCEMAQLFGALGHSSMCNVLQAHMYLSKLQHAGCLLSRVYAGVTKIDERAKTLSSADAAAFVSAWRSLTSLKVFLRSSGVSKHFEEFMGLSERYDLKNVPFDRFQQHSEAGFAVVEQQVEGLIGRWVAELLKHTEFLRANVPDFTAHVVKKWDTDWITKNLLGDGNKWVEVTSRWNQMSVLKNSLTDACRACTYNMTTKNPEAHALIAETIESTKVFVGVVQTCSLILETLPATPTSSRPKCIEGHNAKLKTLGITLPQNLRSHLDNEYKKMTFSKR